MNFFLNIKVSEGATLPSPSNNGWLLSGQEAKVPNTSFWRRRLKEKSCVLVQTKTKKSSSSTKKINNEEK